MRGQILFYDIKLKNSKELPMTPVENWTNCMNSSHRKEYKLLTHVKKD